jgi:hypothetical protein
MEEEEELEAQEEKEVAEDDAHLCKLCSGQQGSQTA